MKDFFELDWQGGLSETCFRRLRPGIEEMPWGSFDPSRYPTILLNRARFSWTMAAWNEYCTAAAFTELIRAMLEAKAPIDMIGMASDFLVDEMLHVELTSRLAMDLGGGAPLKVDFQKLTFPISPDLNAFQAANEYIIRICCVAETFSLPMLHSCLKTAAHPLSKAVLTQIVRDEANHGLLGFHYLKWAVPLMNQQEKERLAEAALDMLQSFSVYWRNFTSTAQNGVTTEGFSLNHIHELGWTEAQTYTQLAKKTVREEVVKPLERFGIKIDPQRIHELLS